MGTLISNLWLVALAIALYKEKIAMNRAFDLKLNYGLYIGRNFWGRISFRDLKSSYHFISYDKPKERLKKLIQLRIWIAVWFLISVVSFLVFHFVPLSR